jgi:5-methylcytosine-specific restriction endonuclease McrA
MRRLPQRIELHEPPSRVAGDSAPPPDSGKAGGLEAATAQAVNLNVAGGLSVVGGPSVAGGPQLCPDGVAPAPVGVVVRVVTARPPTVEALAPGRYRVQFTASTALRDKLERLRAFLQPTVPDVDLATVIELAITEKLERLEARRFAQSSRRRKELSDTDTTPRSRHVPAAVRRAVREGDGRQCGFVSKGGRRCSGGDRLEYHHRHPFRLGGDHSPANVVLLCRTHNAWLAEQDYGRSAIARHRSATQATKPGTTGVDAPGGRRRRRRTILATDA